jgi:hypothetical protein
MGKTYDIADNLVKSASSLRYDDFDAKDKIIQYAGKLIREEFGSTSLYMQKLGLIVFSPSDGAVLAGMGTDEKLLKKQIFENGVEKLKELLTQVRDAIGGAPADNRVIVVQAKDKISAARIVSHIKAKGVNPLVIKDSDNWQEILDEML